MADKREILDDVRNLLEYAKALGMSEVRDTGPGTRDPKDQHHDVTRFSGSRVPGLGSRTSDKAFALNELRAEIGDCMKCNLHKGRKNLVFGVGNPDTELVFIGEGPGADEDEQGIPFVGRAGGLLTKIIEAMGYKRNDVYICNIVKCRPPGNRNPEDDEVLACLPFLIKQVGIIHPKVIVCLGSIALQSLLGTGEKISKVRGHMREWRGIPVMPTYHPAFLLRNPAMKKPVWEDMKKVMKMLSDKRGA